jgi:hypothetical protein
MLRISKVLTSLSQASAGRNDSRTAEKSVATRRINGTNVRNRSISAITRHKSHGIDGERGIAILVRERANEKTLAVRVLETRI